jgi:hypothetical protein
MMARRREARFRRRRGLDLICQLIVFAGSSAKPAERTVWPFFHIWSFAASHRDDV